MSSVERALAFLETQPRPVEQAWARLTVGRGNVEEVSNALSGFQNIDGGFGHNLEVDIKAPESQPFAARLAMHVAIDCGIPISSPVLQRLSAWLETEQGDDGCWRFPAAVFDHPIAPWFRDWTFPSLNPALCLAGLAKRLGIGSERLFSRAESLVRNLAKIEDAESGEFYEVLPYAEYFPRVEHPQRELYLDAMVRGIQARVESGKYDDAGHFFSHVGGPSGEIAKRARAVLIQSQLDRLQGEQAADGGWPSPYDPLWRAWATADALSLLRAYGRK